MSDIFNFVRRGIGPDGRVVGTFQPSGIRPRFLDVCGSQVFSCRPRYSSGRSKLNEDLHDGRAGCMSRHVRHRGAGDRGDDRGSFEASEAAPPGSRTAIGARPVRRNPDIRREEKVSGIAWLNHWMVKTDMASRSRLIFHQADMKTSAETPVADLFDRLGGDCLRDLSENRLPLSRDLLSSALLFRFP